MTILIAGGASPLAADLARLLTPSHRVIALADGPTRIEGEVRPAGDGSPEAMAAAVDGVDAVVWLASFELPREVGVEALDVGGRRLYNLTQAAIAAKLQRLLLVSSLELLADHDPDLILSEVFQPRPTCDPWQLGLFCAEQLVREVIRESELPAMVVRLGRLVREDEVAGRPFDPFWLDPRDAALALAMLLGWRRPPGRNWWWEPVIHLCADRPDAASPPRGGRRRRRRMPVQHRFEQCPPRETA